ncbi:MAG: cobalt-precorrin-5B (C(1))-methyltransferase [Chloroflexi bacterium]|nr:cobalt-precorrin-5B (C(1))-methyltransferase [Chloroflexota bacterium]MDA1269635.1 cobalt-precorrin-5B (C(1))-methyltransferase [Chloroflexota bacterium]
MSPANEENGRVNPTPESDYSRPTVRGKGMRTGYTTGACATAATKAAVTALLTGTPLDRITIHLPMGSDVEFKLNRCEWTDRTPGSEKVLCSVIKDGGDDPDATHGAEICATISVGPASEEGVTIKGGVGVGIVTFPGTGIPVGEPAVTRVPRRMIIESALEAAQAHGLGSGKGIIVELSVPTGEEVALKTTNARLGVIGGISILGSTGVVQPYSTAAWRASVNLAIDVAATNKIGHMVLSTGLQSEAFTKNHLDLPDMSYVGVGIFSGAALKRCVSRGIGRATHVGMVGKFSKMAMGYFVTHVAGNKVDTEFLAGLAGKCGASEELQKEMAATTSGRHFGEIALANNQLELFSLMSQMVCDESHKLLGDDAGKLIVDAMCFDFDGTLLGYASTSPEGIPRVSSSEAA